MMQVLGHALAGAALALGALTVSATAGPGAAPRAPRACAQPAPLATIRLVPTARANGAAGTVELRFAASPFGVAVSPDGRLVYRAEVRTSGVPANGARVVWATSPDLAQVRKLGTLDDDGALTADVDLNKFLLFVTAEASAGVERWSGPILLRGISPSGRMHTMAGHGPFSSEPCGSFLPPR